MECSRRNNVSLGSNALPLPEFCGDDFGPSQRGPSLRTVIRDIGLLKSGPQRMVSAIESEVIPDFRHDLRIRQFVSRLDMDGALR